MKIHSPALLSSIAALAVISYISINTQTNSLSGKTEQGEGFENGSPDEAQGRIQWEFERLADPSTGTIPDNVREKELAYAATLPSSEGLGFQKANALTWVNRGPWNLGGRTRAFALDATNENILLAGSTSGGVWRSIDAGTTWANTTPLGMYHGPTCIAQDLRNNKTNVWYYGTGEAYGASASGAGAYYLGNGIYKSTDGGLTWNSLPSTATNTPQQFENLFDIVWGVKTDSSDAVNDVVYAATIGGIFRSIDGGTTWTAVIGGNLNTYSYFTDVEVTPSGVVYATLSSDSQYKGIYRSDDGVNFTNITPPNFPTAYNRLVITYAPSDETQIYILGNTPGFGQLDTNFQGDIEGNSLWKYKYLSGDGDSASGGLWEDRSANLPTSGGWFDKFDCQGSYDLVVKVKPNDTTVVFIGGTNVYRSTDAFTSLNNTTFIGGYEEHAALPIVNMYANHHPDQHGIWFSPSNPDVMYSNNDGGVFKTSDNMAPTVVWASKNNGYLTSMFYTVAVDHATPNNNIVIGGAQDNGSWYTNSANPTDPWVTPRGGDGSYCAIADGQSAYYFSIQNGKMMKATLDANGGVTQFTRIDPIGAKSYQFINPFLLDPNNNNIMYMAGGKRIWRNNDLSTIPYAGNFDSISTNWYPYTDSLTVSTNRITALGISKTPANILYYGTNAKKVYKVLNANANPNGTPVLVSSNTMPNGTVSCIAVDPHDANKVMVTYSNYSVQSIWYTANGGTNWTPIGGNLEPANGTGPSARWATFAHIGNATAYFVATSTGLYATTFLNGSNTVWVQQAANEIGNQVCTMMDWRESDGLLVVATHAQGIFSSNITNVDQVGVPKQALLSSDLNIMVYPNPFVENTTIEVSLSDKQQVQLIVSDELGRTIKVLANETFNEGKHSFTFSKENLSAGVYYVTFIADGRRKSKQLVVN